VKTSRHRYPLAWTEAEVLSACRRVLTQNPEFGLDDALWCYATEPRCSAARQKVYSEIGREGKDGLIEWDECHTQADRLVVLDRILNRIHHQGEPCPQP